MKTTITLAPKEIEIMITKALREQGFQVEGNITFNVTAGYNDPCEHSSSGLTSVQATVSTIMQHTSSNSLASQIAAVESQGQMEGR